MLDRRTLLATAAALMATPAAAARKPTNPKFPEAFLEQVRDGLLVITETAGTNPQADTLKLGLIQSPGPDTLCNFLL